MFSSFFGIDHFTKHLVTFEEFVKDPSVLANPKLVIRLQNKFFNWQMAGPLIVSQLAFQRPLPDVSMIDRRIEE